MTPAKDKGDRFGDQLNRAARPMPSAEEIFVPVPPPVTSPIPSRKNDKEVERLREMVDQLQQRTSALAIQDDGTLLVQGVQLSSTGLVAPEDMTQDAWYQLGQLLFKLEGSIQWLIGDWLVYGAELKYGDITQLANEMGREPQTFIEYAHVCRNVQLLVRTNNLSYSHHKLVAPLENPEDQKAALDYAVEHGLSLRQFRDYLNSLKNKPVSARAANTPFKPTTIVRQLENFFKQDPSLYPDEDKETARNYIQQMRSLFDEWEAKL